MTASTPQDSQQRSAAVLLADRPIGSAAQAVSARARTVLYVEDHPVNVLLMQALFDQRPGCRLRVAVTGQAGEQAALQERPDLLLLDLRLPDCHGAELLQKLRAHPALACVPAIAVTADDTSDALPPGFLEVWRKPLDLQRTLERIDTLLLQLEPHAADSAGASARVKPAPARKRKCNAANPLIAQSAC